MPTETNKWEVLHIFGFGDVKVISKGKSATVKAADLTTLNAVIDMVYDTKPADNLVPKEYHNINMFYSNFADWQSKRKGVKGFRTPYKDLDNSVIELLVDEMYQLSATQPTQPATP